MVKNQEILPQGMLAPYRGLDLAGFDGYVCGKILADLGADIIKIEKPGGDPARDVGPFYKDVPDREMSLSWFVYNANKKGITLNLESADGREIFRRLVGGADFVIESFRPGHMESLGLGYRDLTRLNPRIIMASISPFGQVGPYRDFAASDIVIQAMCGSLGMAGDPDRPPVQVGYPQAFLYAGLEAAVGCTVALNFRAATGEGQHVDVSMQRAMLQAAYDSLFWLTASNVVKKRGGSMSVRPTTGVRSRRTWACKDGYVGFVFFGGRIQSDATRRFVEWMDEEGFPNDYLKKVNWNEFDWSKVTQAEVDEIEKPVESFFLRHSMQELYEKGIELDIMLSPLYTAKDLLTDRQLLARGYWIDVEHEDLNTTITYPGAWIKASETPLRALRRAPRIGEHNYEVFCKGLGLSRKELASLKTNGVI